MKLYTYQNEHALVEQIKQLKLEHVKSADMTVVHNNRPTGEFRGYTDVEFVKAKGSVWEKFIGKIFNRDPETLIARRFNLDRENTIKYHDALENNKYILIVNSDIIESIEKKEKKEVPETKYTDTDPLEDEDFTEILDNYGLNSERTFIEEEMRQQSNK